MEPDGPPPRSSDAQRKLLEAIATLKMVRATYNGTEMLLAPHQLFARRGEPFVAAFNPAKNRGDQERRLGYFKVSGLSRMDLLDEGFEPLPSFDGSLPSVDDVELFSVACT
jgi:hypothetical protein